MPKQHDPIALGLHTADQADTGAPATTGCELIQK